ncbi:MAG: polysaccharide deacetylase family protein [Bdellovibrionales bacterium]|nr:polysaccharide deacetylase family protein [Bdellovibrionales bacterium]
MPRAGFASLLGPPVVPTSVRVRVAVYAVLVLLVIFAPILFFAHAPLGFRVMVSALLFNRSVHTLWCFWPRLTWGIPAELLARNTPMNGQDFALTFDDGPSPQTTAALLDLLARHQQKASFFVLMHKARRSPQLVKRMVAEGHTVGLHGEDHRKPFFKTQSALARSLGTAKAELEAMIGQPVTLYRPSHGWKTRALVRAAHHCDLQLCFWDYGVWDTDAPPASTLQQRLSAVLRFGRDQKGSKPVILLHDGRGDEVSEPAHKEAMLQALDAWLSSKETRA